MVPKLGYKSQRALYGLYASAKDIFDLPAKELYAMFGPTRADIAAAILQKTTLPKAEEELLFLEKKKAKALFMTDEEYPQRMNHCDDTPPLIYYRGQAQLNATHVIGMVGTRKATAYGVDAAGKIIEGLVGDDILIVSGLALGIDAASHRAACESGIPTVGVVAHGFDRFYPPCQQRFGENDGERQWRHDHPVCVADSHLASSLPCEKCYHCSNVRLCDRGRSRCQRWRSHHCQYCQQLQPTGVGSARTCRR